MKTLAQLLQEGHQHQQQGRWEDAARAYRQILRIKPNNANVIGLLGLMRLNQLRFDEALEQFDKATRLEPGVAEHHYYRGFALNGLKHFAEAAAAFQRAYELKPDLPHALGEYALCVRTICDWSRHDWLERELMTTVREQRAVVNAFTFLKFSDDPADQLACARMYALRDLIPASMTRRIRPPSGAVRDRIRIGYLSADFCVHPVAHLIVGLIEQHDRKRFEVAGISLGPNDRSEVRTRFETGFDHFIDLGKRQDDADIRRIEELELDILVDLMGFTLRHWMAALAYGFAPIQVNFLGYPGTLGTDLADYILVDPFVVPADQQPFYREKLVHLPDSYQPNDPKRAIADRAFTRSECGLPDEGFVFCCFNNNFKITPGMFEVWMRLLKRIPGSVFWILKDQPTVETNLRREAEARGIDPGRLVFAPRILPLADHLARHRLADLFLDTFPYNAHTTASDALWAGLPIVTCAGKTFPARVAGSLLRAIGLPDLVTTSLEEYEALAFKLATVPARLKEVRERLVRNRLTTPLFDLDRYRRHIEAAYETMVEIGRRGEPPRAFAVKPID